jgi:formamidopyrimidine-DNA glycosylase
MPELPEVQTVVDTLRPGLLHRQILALPTLRRDIVTPPNFDIKSQLEGRTVTDITRRGKRIVFTLDGGNRFYIHLGMSGRLTLEADDAPVQKHTHAIIQLGPMVKGRRQKAEGAGERQKAEGRGQKEEQVQDRHLRGIHSALCPLPSAFSSLRFRDPRRFGGIWWLGKDSPAGDMGPEPLLIRPSQLARRLARTTRAIKNVLLDQTVLAGIGNIYADESLFLARIHPRTPADRLTEPEVKRLTRAIKLTLRRALRHRGSTLRDYVDADDIKGAYQKQHRVYDQKGKPCHTCKTPIARIVLGNRSTHFCPNCQPERSRL